MMLILQLIVLVCSIGFRSVAAHPAGATLTSVQAGEACSVGYCTQNGGTTGGARGRTVTVTNVDALIEAADSDEPLIIVISGSISGSAKVRVASDKTIVGEPGSCACAIILTLV